MSLVTHKHPDFSMKTPLVPTRMALTVLWGIHTKVWGERSVPAAVLGRRRCSTNGLVVIPPPLNHPFISFLRKSGVSPPPVTYTVSLSSVELNSGNMLRQGRRAAMSSALVHLY